MAANAHLRSGDEIWLQIEGGDLNAPLGQTDGGAPGGEHRRVLGGARLGIMRGLRRRRQREDRTDRGVARPIQPPVQLRDHRVPVSYQVVDPLAEPERPRVAP